MTKIESKKRKALNDAQRLFAGMSKQEAIEYIEKYIPSNKLSKALIVAFITQFKNDDDEIWLDEFKQKIYVTREKLSGEIENVFLIGRARSEFLKHYGINAKSGFGRTKRTDPKFDEFSLIF